MPPSADPAFAVRESVVVSRFEDVALVRFRGPEARDAVDRLCAGPLRVRDGQLQHLLPHPPGCARSPPGDPSTRCDPRTMACLNPIPVTTRLACLFGAAALLAACGPGKNGADAEPAPSLVVTAVAPVAHDIERTITVSGSVAA